MYSGNRESFNRAFLSSDSIILWVIKSNFGKNSKRQRYPGYFKKPEFSHLEVIEIKNQKEADSLLNTDLKEMIEKHLIDTKF